MNQSPGQLARVLAALPVRVSSVTVQAGLADVAAYPGGRRPTSVVCLSGAGQSGFGENVAFTTAEHEAFVAEAPRFLSAARRDGAGTVAGMVPPRGFPLYARAALEAALIDLGLRQAGMSLADLTGAREASLRFVVSFDARPDPVAHVQRLRVGGHAGDLKIDVDPSWAVPTWEALGREPGIAILDFKGRGDASLAGAAADWCPGAILEDPPVGTTTIRPTRISRDAPLTDADAVAAAVARHESVNLKAPRMGGPLEVLRALQRVAAAAETGGEGGGAAAVYLGGMFEVGVGRTQARQLAALFCPEGPNDLAPVVGPDLGPVVGPVRREVSFEASPMRVRLDTPGFGTAAQSG